MRSANAPPYLLPFADIDWETPLTPRSTHHGDIYWSRDSSIAEKRFVFLDANHLDRRWGAVDHRQFTIGEIGFGFGINFLLSATAWRERRPAHAVLNYITFENRPVTRENLATLYRRLWGSPELAETLIEHYPLPSPGMHTLRIDRDIYLHLVFGDVDREITQVEANMDAWFLDGFSPSSNTDAWLETTFRQMARMSRPGATIATYSVAGRVRRGLAAAGFEVESRPGFGRKAEMLTGRLPGEWQARELHRPEVGIVGAGLAGLHCARSLARRGIRATVFEQGGAPLAGASSIPQLAVFPQLAVDATPEALFSLAAFQYALREPGDVHRSGRCQLAADADADRRLQRIAAHFPDEFVRHATAAEIDEFAGAPLDLPGLVYPTAGWCRPQDCSTGAESMLLVNSEVTAVEKDAESATVVLHSGDRRQFDRVIIAGGAASFPETEPLRLIPFRGQSVRARLPGVRLRSVVGGPVSIIPDATGIYTIGSTYSQDDRDASIREADTNEITNRLAELIGEAPVVEAAFAGVRCMTRDRLPIAGRLPDWSSIDAPSAPNDSNTAFVLTGFGSHGAAHAPMCAELVTRLITGEPVGHWLPRLDPARFELRARRRQGRDVRVP